MNEYRCTRNEPYINPNCFGHTNLASRSGYYLKAESEQGANALMEAQFPHDTAGFTSELWKIDCPVCRGKGHQIPHSLSSDGSVQTGNPVTCELCQGRLQVELADAKDYYDRI